ncbi:hypothetical protein HZH68_009572 [Vespula germanica]|uniref:Uncharacterized protein n=1 Tax=Vespula germanica TaxID=30212 RepID=A0A834N425_VESGE|nr:hypothetical protein HZH68_009572 [Vespula germanica]
MNKKFALGIRKDSQFISLKSPGTSLQILPKVLKTSGTSLGLRKLNVNGLTPSVIRLKYVLFDFKVIRTMSPGTRLRLPIAAITLFLGKTTGHFSFQGNLEGLLEEIPEDSDTEVVAGELTATGAAELT